MFLWRVFYGKNTSKMNNKRNCALKFVGVRLTDGRKSEKNRFSFLTAPQKTCSIFHQTYGGQENRDEDKRFLRTNLNTTF